MKLRFYYMYGGEIIKVSAYALTKNEEKHIEKCIA
jgi:hypothetical protein